MKPRVGLIIQARLSSTRFPNKILADLLGKPVLEHVVERCHEAKLVDQVVIAAPHPLGICLNEELFIGSEDDVLDRYYQCATKYNFKIIVRITADCPLTMPSEIDRCITRLLERNTHYVTNRPAMQDGFDVEVFTYQALKEAHERWSDEHVTTWMKTNTDYNPIHLEAEKLSLDTAQDLERIKDYVRRQADTYNRGHWQLCSELPQTYSAIQQA